MNHAEIEKIYGELANKLVDIIPVEWDKIILKWEWHAEDVTTFYYAFYESESKSLKEINVLSEEYGIERRQELTYHSELEAIIEKLQNTFKKEGHEPWNIMTFILQSSGKFKINFEYIENLSFEGGYERFMAWRAKYLNNEQLK